MKLFCALLAFAFASGPLLTGCASRVTEEDRKLAGQFGLDCYNAGKNTPAEYASNQCGNHLSYAAKAILDGRLIPSDPSEFDKARAMLRQLESDIETGRKWPEKTPPVVFIPHAAEPPVIDAAGDDPAWRNALTFQEEYLIGSREKQPTKVFWKVLWDETYFYVFCRIPQESAVSNDQYPFLEDAVEIFIGSGVRFRTYWEVVIAPDGAVYDALGQNDRWGAYIATPEESIRGLRTAAKLVPHEGYSVEIALPWSEIPGYEHGNPPRSGNMINFTLIRCRNGRQSACHPLLYGGHNIFGHLRGKLVK